MRTTYAPQGNRRRYRHPSAKQQSNRPWGSVERLSKIAREITPPDLADYLVERVRLLTGSFVVAALFLCKRSPYLTMPGVEAWTPELDARVYPGPWPVIAHPPCGPWGNYRHRSRQDASLGLWAMECVHHYGGVVEQPIGSSLFREHGRPGADIERIMQLDFGHTANKATALYWYVPPSRPASKPKRRAVMARELAP